METRELLRENWTKTFDSLSRMYSGSTATLEILDGDLGAQIEVDELPLRGITCDASGIEMIFVTRDGQHLAHRITNPQRIHIEERDDGFVAAIGIVSSSEPEAILRLHQPLPSRLLPRET
ncbi:MAG: DUF5335 family protein [Acidobacteria bacterium]|nr:DUF5335 family protein [Acidobacteriota bacterium]MBV9067880.1 DUF5335 family protein [Acidobacteriota bacterium]MBV9186765.1 DUF5335 family protein [Acidobacteriota bacterium]